MALIKCPECNKEISDKAKSCINCGYPLEEFQEENTFEIESELKETAIIEPDNSDTLINEQFSFFNGIEKSM